MAKEASLYGKRGRFIWQKWPIYLAKAADLYGGQRLMTWLTCIFCMYASLSVGFLPIVFVRLCVRGFVGKERGNEAGTERDRKRQRETERDRERQTETERDRALDEESLNLAEQIFCRYSRCA